MNLDILYKLREQLKNSVITGVAVINEDFRLKRNVEDMETLSKAAPVFAQIEKQAKELFICNNPGERVLDLLALTDAVLKTQAGIYEGGELSEITEGGTRVLKNYSYKMLEPVITALTTSGGGRYDILLNARKETPEIFLDYRVFPKYIAALGDGYSEIAYMVSKWMMEDGKIMTAPLKRGFDPLGKNDMLLRLETIAYIAKADENDFYLSILEGDASKNIRLEAISALGYTEKNKDILIEIAKTGDKAGKEAAIKILKGFKNPEIDKLIEESVRKK